jgi:tetratricopeptide (TPR) repeat protein
MIRRLVLAAAIASVLAPLPARAQPPSCVPAGSESNDARDRSRAAFRKGVADAHDGDYVAARQCFSEAYKLFPHPSILLNLGISRARTGEWLEAEQDLVHFLADDGGAQPDEVASARSELAQVRGHLGTFRLRVSPDGAHATLDARPIALLPGSFVDVRAPRGKHDLHVEADGYAPTDRTVAIAADRASDVDVALAAVAGGTPPPGPTPDGRRTLGWLFVGASVVAAGVGLYAGIQAKALSDQYNVPGSASFQDPSTKAKGITFRTSADVAFLSALALAGVGLYFVLTSPPSGAGGRAGIVLGPLWSGVSGSF